MKKFSDFSEEMTTTGDAGIPADTVNMGSKKKRAPVTRRYIEIMGKKRIQQKEEVEVDEAKIPSNYLQIAARAKKKAKKAALGKAKPAKQEYEYSTHSTGIQKNGKKETIVVKHGRDPKAADAAHKNISKDSFSRHILNRKPVKEATINPTDGKSTGSDSSVKQVKSKADFMKGRKDPAKNPVRKKFREYVGDDVEFNESISDLLESNLPINMLIPNGVGGGRSMQSAAKSMMKNLWRDLTGKQQSVVYKVHKLTQSDDELGKIYRDGWKGGGTSMKPGARKAFDARVKELLPNEATRDYVAAWKSVKAKVQSSMKDQKNESVDEAKKVLPTAHSAVKHVSSGLGTKKLNSDGSATITTKSATMADHVLRGMNDHGIEHNNSEKALKNHKQSGKHAETGKKFKVQVSSKDGRTHTIHVKESVEQVDELSQGLKKRYINRAAMSAASNAHSDGISRKLGKNKHKDKVLNRLRGINRATKEEVEQVDELSTKLLKRYDRKNATSGANLRKKMNKTADTVRKSASGYATPKQAARFTKAMDKHSNRMDGANRSQQTQLKRAQKESVEQVDEVIGSAIGLAVGAHAVHRAAKKMAHNHGVDSTKKTATNFAKNFGKAVVNPKDYARTGKDVAKGIKSTAQSLRKKMKKESVDEGLAIKSGNEGGGYYNTSHNVKHGGNETKTKSGYAKTHADVKKHTGGEDTHVRDYLDSKRGRHLVGKEQDKGYIKKDFAKFSKTYKASDYKWS